LNRLVRRLILGKSRKDTGLKKFIGLV
jgi:hypothetical protein